MLVQWDDRQRNRHVLFSVDYSINESSIVISHLNPIKITFTSAESDTVIRSIGIHTRSGRQMIRRQFMESNRFTELIVKISNRHGRQLAY